MSDISQGEGWWQASDHKWYPPEQHPGFQAPAAPTPEPPPQVTPAPVASVPPPAAAGKGKWIVVGVLAVAVIGLTAFLLFGRDDEKTNTVAVSSSTSTSNPSTSSSSSSSSSSQLTESQLQARMLSAKDLGPTFKDGTFTVNSTTPTPCGQENLNARVPPTTDVGSQATDTATKAFFQEELSVYKDTATAARAFNLGKQGLACTQGTTASGETFTFSPARDVSSDLGVPGIAIDYQIGTTTGELIAVQSDTGIISFQFEAPANADKSALPDALTIAKQGLVKLNR